MKERLFRLLSRTVLDIYGTSVPLEGRVFLQGTIEPDEAYPDTFVTFFTDDTDDRSFYDNELESEDWHFSVILYSTNPTLIEEARPQIIDRLKRNGFIAQGRGRDIPSDVPTHTGWAMDFVITEYIDN